MSNTSFFNGILTTIAERGRSLLERSRKQSVAEGVEGVMDLCAALLTSRGEASGIALAAEILNLYDQLDDIGKTEFFRRLSDDFQAPKARLEQAAKAYLQSPDEDHAATLLSAAEPRRQELIRRLNQAPGATFALVKMREDMLQYRSDRNAFAQTDADFSHLFRSWFNQGFLELRHIDWNTSASVLEKIIQHEAVHTISDWDELRARIDPADRRLYGFFHPRLDNEPLIFVEVALMDEVANSINAILAVNHEGISPNEAKAAVFYSISNCQKGLRGISFGHFLIKQVASELGREFPNLKTFSTLSPLPKFAQWLATTQASGRLPDNPELAKAIQGLQQKDWWHDENQSAAFEKTLSPYIAHYLVEEKNASDRPFDPVASFHLGNGAMLERINWLADTSSHGLGSSHGAMVNYHYTLDDIEKNHEAFANDGTITTSTQISRLADQAVLNEVTSK